MFLSSAALFLLSFFLPTVLGSLARRSYDVLLGTEDGEALGQDRRFAMEGLVEGAIIERCLQSQNQMLMGVAVVVRRTRSPLVKYFSYVMELLVLCLRRRNDLIA